MQRFLVIVWIAMVVAGAAIWALADSRFVKACPAGAACAEAGYTFDVEPQPDVKRAPVGEVNLVWDPERSYCYLAIDKLPSTKKLTFVDLDDDYCEGMR